MNLQLLVKLFEFRTSRLENFNLAACTTVLRLGELHFAFIMPRSGFFDWRGFSDFPDANATIDSPSTVVLTSVEHFPVLISLEGEKALENCCTLGSAELL